MWPVALYPPWGDVVAAKRNGEYRILGRRGSSATSPRERRMLGAHCVRPQPPERAGGSLRSSPATRARWGLTAFVPSHPSALGAHCVRPQPPERAGGSLRSSPATRQHVHSQTAAGGILRGNFAARRSVQNGTARTIGRGRTTGRGSCHPPPVGRKSARYRASTGRRRGVATCENGGRVPDSPDRAS
jgi:hypothetical protein